MHLRRLLAAASLLASPLLAQEAPAPKKPLQELPYTPSLEPGFMDRSVDPCSDLYTYSCGGWMKQNPIPADQAQWSVYGKLYAENQQYLWGLLEQAAKPAPGRTPVQQKIGDYFSACMAEDAVEKAGATPLAGDLGAISALRSKGDIPRWLAGVHLRVAGSPLFGFGAEQDPGNSERVIAWASAGGLGLPDRDYYIKDDARSVEIRKRYVEHVSGVLVLAGATKPAAALDAAKMMRIETALAKATLSRVEQRDPYKIYHLQKVAKLQETTPAFRWADYLDGIGLPVDEVNVTEPAFFQALNAQLVAEPLEVWKAYLRWHLLRGRSPFLSSAFAKADFDFYRGFLRGVKQQEPRWKRCVAWVDQDLGEALGQVFVEKNFSPQVKARALDMVERIEKAMAVRVEGLDWMSEATRKQALAKLQTLRNKIGYPDRFRDYAALEIKPGDFLGNVERATAFESRRQLGKVGKPVDRGEWGMTPPTVNAYYNPLMNDINFPAGVLLPPLFDAKLDDAPNYGNTGGTIGHELIHGFDDEGRQFDAQGNLKDWWSEADGKEFEKRVSCIADQYAQYTIIDDIKINSRLTLGEDVADLGGLILAWVAWKDAVAGQKLEPRDGLTPEQRFFVGFAQWDCNDQRDENKRVNALTNPHSPGIYRINGPVANMPEFAQAFGCKPGARLVRPAEQVCKVW
jgi:endothelin-converting enzyme/putative endopeptidase